MILRRADKLKPGDVLSVTMETVIRIFTDAMTERHKINLLLSKNGRDRMATYIKYRKIRLVG